jgi:hypothetical protein
MMSTEMNAKLPSILFLFAQRFMESLLKMAKFFSLVKEMAKIFPAGQLN